MRDKSARPGILAPVPVGGTPGARMPSLTGVILRTLRATGATAIARRARPGAVVLCYHNVVQGSTPSADPGLHLDVQVFAEQVDWLASRFDVVSLHELERRARQGARLRGLAAITFDDAYQGALTHGLEVLRGLGLHSTVFVPTAAPADGRAFWWDRLRGGGGMRDGAQRHHLIETLAGDGSAILLDAAELQDMPAQCLPASWEQIRRIRSSAWGIEAHSVTHRTLPRLGDETLRAELTGAAESILANTGVRPDWVAYPYGRWDARVAAAVRAAGYRGGWTLDGRDVEQGTDFMCAPRINIPASLGIDAFIAWVSGLMHWRSRFRGARPLP